ncbi:MAG TPA: enoyl-CoA hydratase [Acetobacteraceae bacterium]|jgi:enoyl-CoA hydratase/carnithine racemase|nr:enoyl-CoA hydratase [Acetobacteraceae bacterium]
MNEQSAVIERVLLRRDTDGVAWLTLNRPAARNALSMALMLALVDELAAIKQDPAVKVVVIGGAGPAFCAGHDLRELRSNPERATYQATFELCSRLMTSIVRLPKPVIARVHGVATAAGCQLVASCDLAIAADTARFATPGVNIGLFCSTPMVALSRAVGRKAAMEMLLTGELIDASRAHALGLVNRVVADNELDDAVAALTGQIVAKSPLTLAIGKEAFYRQAEMGLDDAYAYASQVMTRNMLARDAGEGIDAFLGKRQPVWTGT